MWNSIGRKLTSGFINRLDENDNHMSDGESKIFVYKYKENSSFSIGRVYVNDLDDWDLPDKTFNWLTSEPPDFTLDIENGNINMKPSAQVGTHELKFQVPFALGIKFDPFAC
jgi:hypothetical protein